MKALVSIMMTFLSALPALADAPHVQISNDLMQVTLYLPDAANGFYRGTRFDWSGVVAALQRLPAMQREALALRLYLDLPDDQIAAAMRVTSARARDHVAGALAALRGMA